MIWVLDDDTYKCSNIRLVYFNTGSNTKIPTVFQKKAEYENVTLADLLTQSPDSDRERPVRLRISSETEHDTTNTSHDTSHEKSATKKKANKSLDSSRDCPS